jgi:hypothetical protein
MEEIKMQKPLVTIAGVQREMNEEEFAQYQIDEAQYEAEKAARQAEQDAKAAAKESALTKLQALGLSEAEAKQIVGI